MKNLNRAPTKEQRHFNNAVSAMFDRLGLKYKRLDRALYCNKLKSDQRLTANDFKL